MLRAALFAALFAAAADTPKPDPRAALQPFNVLVGSWKGTGSPEGSREEKQAGFWVERISWEWQFKGDDAWLTVAFEKGKHFKTGELRHNPGKGTYQLTLKTPDDETRTFSGTLKDKVLTLDRTDPGAKEQERLVFS